MQEVVLQHSHRSVTQEIRTEIVRKTIHLSIALTPLVAALVGTTATLAALALGTLTYTAAETQRRHGYAVPIISRLTVLSSRRRDRDHFVLGPITLGIGAMLALLLYPNPAATIAIYALAFGDGLASFAGKLYGRIRIPGTGGKTLEGSLTCAAAVAGSTYLVYPDSRVVIVTALGATILEALPTGDADNLILPVGVGLIVSLVA
ncbi:MAG: diacylglycerol/polyprenol kinase family protein [Alkalispirochaeta sp.]